MQDGRGKIPDLVPLQLAEHRAVFHIMAVDNGVPILFFSPIAMVHKNASGLRFLMPLRFK
ncbi:hypothetical protein [Paenibacillus sp. H1-7]|uniref:hypothetical protein n=1 Tax=Paenibacillus sp. H1-7 TaxID=2282849 RepID=UPI0023BACFE6|nr:hypothetical protein [Paenibacillus sp. H1-7]